MFHRFILILSISIIAFCGVAHAQEFPTRPIRIVTAGAGGATDVASRLIAQELTTNWGQQVFVENHPTGIIPGGIVVKARPDGYTLLAHGSSLWIGPLLQKSPFDPVTDLAPITLMMSSPSLLVVHPSVPAKTIKDLIALAKAKPGALNYGSGTGGSAGHLAAEMLKYMAGVDIVRVPYKAEGPAVLALISGEVQMVFANGGLVAGYIQSGKLRALAIATAKGSELAPGLPTIAESGLPGYESASNSGMFAPVGTPPQIIALLNREVVKALKQPKVKDVLFKAGTEIVASSPEEFAASMKAEIESLGKVIKAAGMRAD